MSLRKALQRSDSHWGSRPRVITLRSIHNLLLMSFYRRIRSLENHVADIKHHQAAISGTLSELLSYVRGQGSLQPRSPQAYGGFSQSPGMQSLSTPSASTPTMASQHVQQSGPGFPPGRHDFQNSAQPGGQPGTAEYQAQNYPQGGGPAHTSNSHTPGPVLPPFSSLQSIGPSPTARYSSADPRGQMPRFHNMPPPGSKRAASNQQSANSSDVEDDDEGLPHSGLVAPWEVLRGLADVAIEQAAKVCYNGHHPIFSSLSDHAFRRTETLVHLTLEHPRPDDIGQLNAGRQFTLKRPGSYSQTVCIKTGISHILTSKPM